ncbi:MAG: hypothetical protein RR528_09195 [Angelakisella sp.]
MIKLTKTKARELVKRELGVQISRLLELDHGWYRADIGNLCVTVYTLEDGRVTQLLLQYSCSSIATHFFTDTLEAFYEYSEMEESQNMDDQIGKISERTRRCECEVRTALREHYCKCQPALPSISDRLKEASEICGERNAHSPQSRGRGMER